MAGLLSHSASQRPWRNCLGYGALRTRPLVLPFVVCLIAGSLEPRPVLLSVQCRAHTDGAATCLLLATLLPSGLLSPSHCTAGAKILTAAFPILGGGGCICFRMQGAKKPTQPFHTNPRAPSGLLPIWANDDEGGAKSLPQFPPPAGGDKVSARVCVCVCVCNVPPLPLVSLIQAAELIGGLR